MRLTMSSSSTMTESQPSPEQAVNGEDARELYQRLNRKRIELLRDAPLFMDSTAAEVWERGQYTHLLGLANEAAKRVRPDARSWQRWRVSIGLEARGKRVSRRPA